MAPLQKRLQTVVSLIAITIAGCSNGNSASNTADPSQVSSPANPIVLSTQDLSGDEALASGTLSINSSCVLLETGDSRLVIVWPPGRAVWDEASMSIDFEHLDGFSQRFTNGENLSLSGSQVARSVVESTTTNLNEDCKFDAGWFVAEIIEQSDT